MSNSIDTRTIYEIFRACRLCGAGDGYKMPIIQNVIPFDCNDVELREKIRDCVQIEVRADDKMPPLICELCVDKVNDFYEFLDMSRQTNKRTRLRLGLPPQTIPQGEPEDCILGVTETVFSNDEERPPPRSRPCPKSKKNMIKVKTEEPKFESPKSRTGMESHANVMGRRLAKEIGDLTCEEQKIKSQSDTSRTTRGRIDSLSSSSSARDTRRSANDDNASLGKIKKQEQKKKHGLQEQTAKSIPKKGKDNTKMTTETDSEDETLSTSRTKRGRQNNTPKAEVPQKKIKLTIKLPAKPAVPTLAAHECAVCGFVACNAQGHYSHMKRHPVLYTSPQLACSPCGEWFSTAEEAQLHHKKHTKYTCRHCKRDYKQLTGYNEHFEKMNCKPFEGLPDVKCSSCSNFFPSKNLLKQHKCPGPKGRPGDQCKACGNIFKSLKRHEEYCAAKKTATKPAKSELPKPAKSEVSRPAKSEVSRPAKSEVSKQAKSEVSKTAKSEVSKPAKNAVRVDRKISKRLLPAKVRVAKCDTLLRQRRSRGGRYNVATVPHDFGLDKNCSYPYKYSGVRVKPEPLCFDGMVSINKEIQRELYREEDYVHWDSDLSSDSENEVEEFEEKRRKVPTLTALTLKTIFSKRCLGKVPRKLRKVKSEKLFDSLFNNSVEVNLSSNINSIIDNLSHEDKSSVNLLNIGINYDSDSVLYHDKSILSACDDLNAFMNDVNNKKYDVNDDTQINHKNDVDCKDFLNDGCESDVGLSSEVDNANKERQDNDTASDITDVDITNVDSVVENAKKDSEDNDIASDRTDADVSSHNGDAQNEINNLGLNTTVENNCETNSKNNQTSIEHKETNNDNTKNTNNDYEVTSIEKKERNCDNGQTYKNRDFSNEKLDDTKLIDDLNAQIGESEMKDIENRQLDTCSFSIDNLIDKPMPQSFGLGCIGDEEFI